MPWRCQVCGKEQADLESAFGWTNAAHCRWCWEDLIGKDWKEHPYFVTPFKYEQKLPKGADPWLVRLAVSWGLHPEEALPRAETWLHERRNWQSEVTSLRAYISELETKLKLAQVGELVFPQKEKDK